MKNGRCASCGSGVTLSVEVKATVRLHPPSVQKCEVRLDKQFNCTTCGRHGPVPKDGIDHDGLGMRLLRVLGEQDDSND